MGYNSVADYTGISSFH